MDESELKITASLAFLEPDQEEYVSLRNAVEKMLDYFSKMAEVDIANLPPTFHSIPGKNRTRNDSGGASANHDALLENAPELEDRFIVIPNVL